MIKNKNLPRVQLNKFYGCLKLSFENQNFIIRSYFFSKLIPLLNSLSTYIIRFTLQYVSHGFQKGIRMSWLEKGFNFMTLRGNQPVTPLIKSFSAASFNNPICFFQALSCLYRYNPVNPWIFNFFLQIFRKEIPSKIFISSLIQSYSTGLYFQKWWWVSMIMILIL